jgi:hypothetical protein
MRKATKPAKAKDYARLAVAASEVVMRTRIGSLSDQGSAGEPEYVVVEFPYFVKFQKGFPKGVIVEKTATSNVHQINAVRLLDWLHENGYSAHSARQLVQRTKDYERLEASINRMFET